MKSLKPRPITIRVISVFMEWFLVTLEFWDSVTVSETVDNLLPSVSNEGNVK